KFFRYFADLMVEIIKGITISKKELDKRMVPRDFDVVQGYLDQGRSVIGATGHYGNWEWTGQAFCMLTDKTRIIVYKPLTNKVFEDFFVNMRARFGGTLVEMKNTMRKMIQFKKDLFISVLVADQTPVKHEAHYFTNFLNQPTAVFLGIEKLAKLIDAPVVFCNIQRIKRGYYTYTFVPLVSEPKQTDEHEITELHVKYLEEMIRQQPEYWLWSHRRWKFKPEDKN
ncbi:MAG: lauroyl acyltransferase, partial [Sphingobacteriaceae bacterium]